MFQVAILSIVRVWGLKFENTKRPDRIQQPGLDAALLRERNFAGRGVRHSRRAGSVSGGTTPSRGMSGGSRCMYATGIKKSRIEGEKILALLCLNLARVA
jgi:hypothetical protein